MASSKADIDQLLSLVHREINRRETLDIVARQRKDQIRREYQPLYPELYQFQVKDDRWRFHWLELILSSRNSYRKILNHSAHKRHLRMIC